MADVKQDRPTYTSDYIKGDYDRSVFLDNAHTDNLTTVVLGLGAEYWAMQRRMMVLEKLIEEKKVVDRASIESYRPTEVEQAAWDAERDDFINRVYGVLTRPTLGRVGGVTPDDHVPALTK